MLYIFLTFFFLLNFLQTEHCGWGVIALEPLQKGDFVIEYIGEGVFKLSLFFLLFTFSFHIFKRIT
jgi:hypothetical protein